MKRLRGLAQAFVRVLGHIGFYWPLTVLYTRVIEEVIPLEAEPKEGRITLLALHPGRFRGDLEILANSGRFRVLKLPFNWQCRLVYLFYPSSTPFEIYYNPDNDPVFKDQQEKLRRFLKGFLPRLYRRLGVDGVIGSATHQRQDYDLGRASNELGYPYIVLHRENLITNSGHRALFIESGRKMRKFSGAHIIVHNEEVRECYIKSGFVQPTQISALGCLRMDQYLYALPTMLRARTRPQVTLFSFSHDGGSAAFGHFSKNRDIGFVHLFDDVHPGFASLARERPDVDFLIKPKWGGKWLTEIDKALRVRGLQQDMLPNLRITADVDAHDAILDSDVVCGFGSTVLLEAAVAGKPVIVPMFREAADPKYEEFVPFRDQLDLFDIARSEMDFRSLIEMRLLAPRVEDDCMERRRAVFDRLVSPIAGNALQQYKEMIVSVIEQVRPLRVVEPAE